jgi:hypothetical protein
MVRKQLIGFRKKERGTFGPWHRSRDEGFNAGTRIMLRGVNLFDKKKKKVCGPPHQHCASAINPVP